MSPIQPVWYEGGLIDVRKTSLWISLGWIVFNPVFWNFVARKGTVASFILLNISGFFFRFSLSSFPRNNSQGAAEINLAEHSTRFLTKLFGSPYRGCYFLGGVIFTIGLIRDHFFKQALEDQPVQEALAQPTIQLASKVLFAIGTILVATSMWALGVTGTYLGDYFGILMDKMVEGFPFNVTNSPMYDGSTLCFLGTALSYRSPAGLILTAIVFVLYRLALRFEDPFTANIYRQRSLKSK